MSTQIQARPLFAATLTPHRSLSRKGLRILVAALAVCASIPAIIFFSVGAWPVVGFLGLDVLAVWWALSASLREGKRYEKVTLWPDQLELTRVAARGKVIDRDYNERTTALHLRTRDSDTEIGSFLNADDKASFAKAFGTALKKARHKVS
jgi:uncharacterized membrane protein